MASDLGLDLTRHTSQQVDNSECAITKYDWRCIRALDHPKPHVSVEGVAWWDDTVYRDMTTSDLKVKRKQLALSQAGLARILGVDVMTVSRWERGTIGIPPYLHWALYGIEQSRNVEGWN